MSIRFTPHGLVRDEDAPADLRPGTDAGRELHRDYCGCDSSHGLCTFAKRVRAIEHEAAGTEAA